MYVIALQVLLENHYYITVRFLSLIKVALDREQSSAAASAFTNQLHALVVNSSASIYELLCTLRHLMTLNNHHILASGLDSNTTSRVRQRTEEYAASSLSQIRTIDYILIRNFREHLSTVAVDLLTNNFVLTPSSSV